MAKEPMTSARYVEIGGVRCPACGSEGIQGESIDIEAGCATQEVNCLECAASWTDQYNLVGYTGLDTTG